MEEEIRKIRLQKIQKLKIQEINPYPSVAKRTHLILEVLENFEKLKEKEIFLVGRIRALRKHGGLIFGHLQDDSGRIQFLIKKDKVGEKSFEFFSEIFDIGDIAQFSGFLIKTKTGEKTLEVLNFKMLAKALRPLPEKWHGLKDVEERFRKRYLDLIFNEKVKERFKVRSKIISLIRSFLEKEGFIEVETPILQPLYGGARARPFKTHLNAQDLDLYLRISPELYLKRLLVGGFEKVFEIGRCFRNEGIDKFHNPDFTMMELYWAFANYHDLMDLVERMFSFLLKEIFHSEKTVFAGKEINWKTPWPRKEFLHLFSRETKINYEEINEGGLRKEAEKMGLKIEENLPKFEIADEIFKKKIRPKIFQPTFLIHYPLGFQALAKASEKNKKHLENFQLIVAGTELINAFSELNDPLEQERRFQEQEKLFKKGFQEAYRFDEDFIEALEYGMPPAAGLGLGIDRLVTILTDAPSLREVIFFPTMREK